MYVEKSMIHLVIMFKMALKDCVPGAFRAHEPVCLKAACDSMLAVVGHQTETRRRRPHVGTCCLYTGSVVE